MVKRQVVVFGIFLLVFISSNAWAHHPTSGAGLGQAGPIRTIPAFTLQKGKLVMALQTEFIKLDSFSDNELRGYAENGNDVHSVDYILHTVFAVGYGISDDFTLSLKVSYEDLNSIKEAHHDEPDEIHNRGDSKGVGDPVIFGQYRFIKVIRDDFESTFLFGLKLPTGKTSGRDRQGERFETEFQPGTGSWNPMFGIAASKRFGQLSLDANVLYTVATKGAQDTDLGDIFHYNAALSYRVLKNTSLAWDLIIEANGEWKQKERIAGVKDENSGEHVLFLSPGTRLSINKQWSAYLSVGFPVFQNLNGIQNKTTSRTVFGISAAF